MNNESVTIAAAVLPDTPKKCSDCGATDALITWAESTMDYVHGNFCYLCRRCGILRQIAHAEQCAAKLPKLRDELRAIEATREPEGR